jgi:hypothetical protein
MAVASAATENNSIDISMEGDVAFALVKRLRKAKAEESGGSDSA